MERRPTALLAPVMTKRPPGNSFARKLFVAEPNHAEIEFLKLQLFQLQSQQVLVPSRQFGEFVVGE